MNVLYGKIYSDLKKDVNKVKKTDVAVTAEEDMVRKTWMDEFNQEQNVNKEDMDNFENIEEIFELKYISFEMLGSLEPGTAKLLTSPI